MNTGTSSILMIQDEICYAYNVSRLDLISDRRHIDVTRPRQIAMHLCRRMTPFSLPVIGRRFKRDHTTVMHADRKILQIRAASPAFDTRIKAIEDKLFPLIDVNIESDENTAHLMNLLASCMERSMQRNPRATLAAIMDALDRLDKEAGS